MCLHMHVQVSMVRGTGAEDNKHAVVRLLGSDLVS